MIKNYFKIAWRNLTRNKVYSFINIFGLALGICACIIIFLITQFELSFDKFHPDNGRIYRIVGGIQDEAGESHFLNNIIPDVGGVQDQIAGFETTAAFHSYDGRISIEDGANVPRKFDNKIPGSYSATAIFTWPSYFTIFQHVWILGSPQTLGAPFNVVLTESRARKYFGNIPLEDMIGKMVIYDDSLRVHVSGIVNDWTERSDFNYTDYISVSTATHSFLKTTIATEDWTSLRPHNGSAFVKLAKNVTPAQVNRELAEFVKSRVQKGKGKINLYLQPLASIHFTNEYRKEDDGDDFRKAYMPTLYILMGIALFILIIATANFINLSTAQSIRRIKEIGVRKVMGGSRKSITVQFLIETLILTIVATVFAALLVDPFLRLFSDFIPVGVTFHLLNSATLIFMLIMIVLTTLLAGFYPARVLSAFLPVLSLKGNVLHKGMEKLNMRKALVIFQFTISLVFITMKKQMNFMASGDKGFNSDGIITINRWGDRGKLKVLAEGIRHIRGVDKVLLQFNAPMGYAQTQSLFKFKGKEELTVQPTVEIGNEDYIPFYKMKLIAGRNMLPSDSLKELVINETLARKLGFANPQDAIGKLLYARRSGDEKPYPVVGVVADFHQGSFHDAILPGVIENAPDDAKRSLAIKLSSGEKNVTEVKGIISQIQKEWKEIYNDDPFDFSFLNVSISWLYDEEEKAVSLVNMATVVTILISCMGLFGLSMFTTERRTKEIGIRKVLGASVAGIAFMLCRDVLKLIIIALIIASSISYIFAHAWLLDFAFRTKLSWWIFLCSGTTAIFIAVATISYHAVRAAKRNPVDSLRTE